MYIYDEQIPFTQEQFEYLKTKFVSKNTAWNTLKSGIKTENTVSPVDWARCCTETKPLDGDAFRDRAKILLGGNLSDEEALSRIASFVNAGAITYSS